jgi:hypothetical protein
MIRTQIQLTDEQAQAIRAIARAQGLSIAQVIRQAVDQMLRSGAASDREEKRRRALQIVGKFSSGNGDVSRNHDTYLAEAFGE